MANKNFGPMHYRYVVIQPVYMFKVDESDPDVVMVPARTVAQQVDASETPWKDVVADIPQTPTTWFIAVDGGGYIMCCEHDPTMVGLIDFDLWQIEHPGPREAIFCQRWNGKEVVP